MVTQLIPMPVETRRLERVDPAQCYVPDWHPRRGWDRQDDALRQLGESLSCIGQADPILVTTIAPEDPLADDYTYLVADGARRVAIAIKLGIPLLADIETDLSGQPLPRFAVLSRWLTCQAGLRPPSAQDLILCLARMRWEWELTRETHTNTHKFPSATRLAEMFHLSRATAWRYLTVSQQPIEVIQAICEGTITTSAALLLADGQVDDTVRTDVFTHVTSENRRRLRLGEPLVTRGEVAELVLRPNVPLPAPQPLTLPELDERYFEPEPEPLLAPAPVIQVLPHRLQQSDHLPTLQATYRRHMTPTPAQVLAALLLDASVLFDRMVTVMGLDLPPGITRAGNALTFPDVLPELQTLLIGEEDDD